MVKRRNQDHSPRSLKAFARAKMLMPGGVSSPVRAYRAVGIDPVFIKSGTGCYVKDIDGHQYVDYVMSYGPLILGHAAAEVSAAMVKVVKRGTSFGMPCELESDLAEMIIGALPGMEMVRFVNSGTEAVMSAIRLARAATGRQMIVKCTGCYHGHSDGLLVQAGSGATTLGVPSSPGVPAEITSQTLLVGYNDLAGVEKVFKQQAGKVAAICVEPVAGNMGCVPPGLGYLAGLRKLCDEHGVLLILDEVMTGFRVAWGGAQVLYKVKPDLTCLGKVIGGGVPCAAYGGKAELMRRVSPEGPVYQAGTLSGNPLAMAAGLATLEGLRDGSAYRRLEETSAALEHGLSRAAAKAGVAVRVQRVGSMLTMFFTDQGVSNYEQALKCDTKAFAVFFREMLYNGVILPPSQFEAWFVSTAHGEEDIDATVKAAEAALGAVAAGAGKAS